MVKIGIIVGSLRKESVTKKLAQNVAELFPSDYDTTFVEIGNLPLYNEDIDLENEAHPAYTEFRNTMQDIDAVLFVTPEYNRSMTGALKNALDVGSRPYGQSIWDGKPAAIISQSPGSISGFGANHHLRQSLVFLNMPVIQQPEAYITGTYSMFDESGKINADNEKTVAFLQTFVDAFVSFIHKMK